jgi:nicotinic acetylcholine receptor
MSILIFMVSDQMPSTSSFIPLIGWFYTSMMGLISGGTLAASFVIYVQKKGIIGLRPSRNAMYWARLLGRLIWLEMPLLMKQAYALKAKVVPRRAACPPPCIFHPF